MKETKVSIPDMREYERTKAKRFGKTVTVQELKLIDIIIGGLLWLVMFYVTILKIIINRGVKYEKNQIQNPKACFQGYDTDII